MNGAVEIKIVENKLNAIDLTDATSISLLQNAIMNLHDRLARIDHDAPTIRESVKLLNGYGDKVSQVESQLSEVAG
jgi:hypothetical protein